MSGRSFYLAAASANVEQAKARISDLESMGWECAYHWPNVMEAMLPLAECNGNAQHVAVNEVYEATAARMFVALAPVSEGVAVEIGARLGTGGFVEIVGEWGHVPFASHCRVRHHASWEFFVASLEGAK